MKIHQELFVISMLAATVCVPTRADQVTLTPDKDNTLYEDPAGLVSNGAGQFLFTGRVALAGGGETRRAVLSFPVDNDIPAGSIVTNITLTMTMSRTPAAEQSVALHRLTADWGEGKSDAPLEEGQGTAAAEGDATWRHRFFSTDVWSTFGGDFVASSSATLEIDSVGSYTWASTTQLVADVQSWVDDPSSNFGWLVLNNETSLATVKRFNSREFKDPDQRPMLTVMFDSANCLDNADCTDGDPCTFDTCASVTCDNVTAAYGDLAGPGVSCGPDGAVDLFDILAVLDGFVGTFAAGCEPINIDLAGPPPADCTPDGPVDLFDIFAVLDAFQGIDACCE